MASSRLKRNHHNLKIHKVGVLTLFNKQHFLTGVVFIITALLVFGGLTLSRAYLKLRPNQVYLFVHSEDELMISDFVLIKSAVIDQPHQLVHLQEQILSNVKSTSDLGVLKVAASNRLKIPIDQVLILNHKVEGRAALMQRIMLYHIGEASLSEWLFQKIDLTWHVFRASMLDLVADEVDELSELFLARSLIQNNTACSIAVINTTDVNGLAGQVSSLLERNGAYVVRIVSNDMDLSSSYVLVDKNKETSCLSTAQKLEGLLPHHGELQLGDTVQIYRADVVIFLGDNLTEFGFSSSNNR